MALDDQSPAQPTPQQVPAVPRLVVSTDLLPEQDRMPFFREALGKVLNVDIFPLREGMPRHTMDYLQAGPIGLYHGDATPNRCVRTRRHLSDSDDDFTFIFVDRGWEATERNGHSTRVGAGEAVLYQNALPSDSAMPDDISVTALRVDRTALGVLVRRPEEAAGPVIKAGRPGLSLLKGYLRAFEATQDTLTPALLQSFGLHVVDLVGSILGATGDGAAQAEAGGIKAARLRTILNAIAARATDPSFSVDGLAAQLAVTPRYVHRLLEETGTTFSEHVLEHRLVRVWRLLADPNCHLKIANIAFESGFNHLSHFNRAFRRRFGESPKAMRTTSTNGVVSFRRRGSRSPA